MEVEAVVQGPGHPGVVAEVLDLEDVLAPEQDVVLVQRLHQDGTDVQDQNLALALLHRDLDPTHLPVDADGHPVEVVPIQVEQFLRDSLRI